MGRVVGEWPVGALHNMSAPPRTHIMVHVLRSLPDSGKREELAAAATTRSDSGLVPVVRVSVSRLLGHWVPAWQEGENGQGSPVWQDQKRLKGRAVELWNLRLRCLVVLSRVAVGELRRPTRRCVFSLADTPLERLEQAYLDNVRRQDPMALDLPPFGLVRPAGDSGGEAAEWEHDPARALALLSRCAGSVYSAGREPRLPNYERPIPSIWLYGFQKLPQEPRHA